MIKSFGIAASVVSLSVLALTACPGGGDDDDDGDNNGTPDASVNLIDAAPQADAAPIACTINPTITEVPSAENSKVFRVVGETPGTTVILWNFTVGDMAKPDLFQLAMPEPITLNTPLNLVDFCTQASPNCWILLGDVMANAMGQPVGVQTFFPDTGTITVTEVGATGMGNFKASITASMINQYDDNGPVMGTCKTMTMAITLDLPIEMPMAKPSQAVKAVETPNLLRVTK